MKQNWTTDKINKSDKLLAKTLIKREREDTNDQIPGIKLTLQDIIKS